MRDTRKIEEWTQAEAIPDREGGSTGFQPHIRHSGKNTMYLERTAKELPNVTKVDTPYPYKEGQTPDGDAIFTYLWMSALPDNDPETAEIAAKVLQEIVNARSALEKHFWLLVVQAVDDLLAEHDRTGGQRVYLDMKGNKIPADKANGANCSAYTYLTLEQITHKAFCLNTTAKSTPTQRRQVESAIGDLRLMFVSIDYTQRVLINKTTSVNGNKASVIELPILQARRHLLKNRRNPEKETVTYLFNSFSAYRMLINKLDEEGARSRITEYPSEYMALPSVAHNQKNMVIANYLYQRVATAKERGKATGQGDVIRLEQIYKRISNEDIPRYEKKRINDTIDAILGDFEKIEDNILIGHKILGDSIKLVLPPTAKELTEQELKEHEKRQDERITNIEKEIGLKE